MNEIQRWECCATAVEDGMVYAQAIDVTRGGTMFEEIMEIPIDNFSPWEQRRMRAGSIFEFVIWEGDDGSSAVEFSFSYRRWTQEEIDEANRKAAELF